MRIDISSPKNSKGSDFRRTLIAALVLALIAMVTPAQAQATSTVFGPFPTMTATYSDGTVKIIHPTTNSNGAWSYTSSNTSIATISGDTAKILSVGTTTITATQAATSTFTERSRSTQLRISAGTPTIGAFPSQTVQFTQKTFKLTAPTSNSNGDWTFTSSNTKVATIIGNSVTLLDGGNVFITATQRATINWIAASVAMTLSILSDRPTLGPFGSISISKDSVASFSLRTPTSNSTGSWTFTSSNPTVVQLVGNVATPLAFGSSVITATQAAIGNFSSSSVSMTLTVKGTSPTLGSFPDATNSYDITTSHTVTLAPPVSNSTGSWSFTSSDTNVALINGSTVTMIKPGRITITAVQAATATYGPSDPVTMTFSITGTPALGVWASFEKVVKDPDFTLIPPTSTSSSDWTFASDNTSVIEIVGNIAKVIGAGLANITATQTATEFFAAATAKMTVRVYGSIPTLGAFASIEGAVGDPAITIKAPTSNSSGAWTFTSSNSKVAVVTGSTLKIVGVGTATLTATQKANGIYSQSNTVQSTITGKAGKTPTPTPSSTSTLGEFANLKIVYGTIAPTLILPKSSSTSPWTFQSSNTGVVTFSGSIIQMRGIGTATITAKQAATSTTVASTRTFTIQVLVPTGPSATPKPTTTPSPSPSPVVKVVALNRVITVSVTGATAIVTINGAKAKVGANTMKPGLYIVLVTIGNRIVFSQTYRIK